MAASVAGSTPAKAAKATSGSRQERSVVKTLAKSMADNRSLQARAERDFVVSRLDSEDADLVPNLAMLLRQGVLKKAVTQLVLAGHADERGKELAPSQTHFKTIRDPCLDKLLATFEPNKFTVDGLANLTRTFKMTLVTFALNVNTKELLPAISPSLRFTTVMAEYCDIRYRRMGSRLAAFNQEEPETFTYLSIDEDQEHAIVLNTTEAGKEKEAVTFPMMAEASDWHIHDGHTQGATLQSKTLCMELQLQPRFAQAGKRMPPAEGLEWSISPQDWPLIMTKYHTSIPQLKDEPLEALCTPKDRKKRSRSGSGRG